MRRFVLASTVAAAVALGAAAPAGAHPGHTSCKPGASLFAKAPGPFGQIVRVAAEDGASEEVAFLHETFCRHDGP